MTDFTELNDIRSSLARLRYQLLGIKLDLKFRKLLAAKAGFNPDQPRDEIGRWTDGGASDSDEAATDAVTDGNNTTGNQVSAVFSDLASFPLATRLARLLGDDGTNGTEPYLQTVGATITYDTARTGIPTIDETTEKLSATLINVMNNMEFIPNRAPNVYGIAVHTAFAASVKLQNLEGIGSIGVEETFSLDDVPYYGIAGSIRTDITLRNVAGEVIAIYDVKTGGAALRASRADKLRDYTKAGAYTPVIELHFHRGSSLKHEPFAQDIFPDSASATRHCFMRAGSGY